MVDDNFIDERAWEKLPPAQQAERLYLRGVDLKKAGQPEAALTEFRRAVLVDPTHFSSQLEIGLLCKQKAAIDPILARLAFDSFRRAARLNLQSQEAHDNYIMLSQKQGRLDELMLEYENWIKQNPGNELLVRCKKNIVTISMAMMPEKVNVSSGQVSGGLRKLMFFGSIGLIVIGLGIFLVPVFMKTGGGAKPTAKSSIALILMGVAGLVLWSRMKSH